MFLKTLPILCWTQRRAQLKPLCLTPDSLGALRTARYVHVCKSGAAQHKGIIQKRERICIDGGQIFQNWFLVICVWVHPCDVVSLCVWTEQASVEPNAAMNANCVWVRCVLCLSSHSVERLAHLHRGGEVLCEVLFVREKKYLSLSHTHTHTPWCADAFVLSSSPNIKPHV